MYKIFFVSFCIVFLCSCSGENDINSFNSAADSFTDTSAPIKTIKRNEVMLDGLTFNLDSITLTALIQYNKVAINGICVSVLIDLLQKDKKIEYKDEIQTQYAFEVSDEDLDSLNYYGFGKDDISFTDPRKPIYISGVSPYKEKGLWERVKINPAEFEQNKPVLYRKAAATYLDNKKPRITNITATDQASKYIDYSAEFEYADGQNVYIYFTVKNVNQHIDITLNKSEN